MQFNNIVQALFSSPASVAIIVAYFLDLTVSRGERSTCRDSGRHWCQKFRTFNQDSRTEDFSIHSLQTWADISPHIECTSILIWTRGNISFSRQFIVSKVLTQIAIVWIYYNISSNLYRNMYKLKDIRANVLQFILFI